MRPFRFLAAIDGIPNVRELTEQARRLESLGFAAVMLPDHLLGQHAPMPFLATVAAVTERLRIGTFVLNNGLRHPAVLAQDLASLDVLSDGRLEIGIGAGWNKPEYDHIGLPFPAVGTRVSELTEAITVLKGCFGAGPFTFEGEHYTIRDYDAAPKPVQAPHPPLFIGGGGRRILSLAGREANIIGLAPRMMPGDQSTPRSDPRSITAEATEEKISWVRKAAGDRFDEIEFNTYPNSAPLTVTNHARREAVDHIERIRSRTGVELTVNEFLDSPHIFIGTVEELTAKILGLRERFGITSILLNDVEAVAPIVERLA